ncbi:MAG: NAD-dependent epimerase/dehydratase family protein [Thermoplasmatota archaeon]
MDDKVLVTGGTGFIGSHVVDELVRSGYRVRVLVRRSSSRSFLERHLGGDKVELFTGDITEEGSLEGMCEGCMAVYHAAALSRDWGSRREFHKVNVTGTINVVTECIKAGIPHIIHVSTCGVIGEEDRRMPKDEASEYRPRYPYFMSGVFPSAMNHYRETKCEAEKAAIELCSGARSKLTVARPVWVYGERELHSGPYVLVRFAARGSRTLPADPDTLFHTGYAGDIARDLVRLLGRTRDGTEIYLIGPRSPMTLREYHGKFIKGAGARGPRYIPRWIGYPAGLLLESLYALFRTENPPVLTRARVDMGFFNNVYDTSKFRKEFGGGEETPFDVGVERCIGWWRDNGYL